MSTEPRAVDLASERAILGACLLWPEAWHRYGEAGLCAEDFYRDGHRRLWTLMQAAASETGRVDYPAVSRMVRARQEETEVGGWAYLSEMQQGAVEPTIESALAAAGHLKRLARTRALAAGAKALMIAAESTYTGLDDAECAAAVATLDGISRQAAAIRVLDAPGQVMGLMAANAARAQSRSSRFGVPAIDLLIDGIRPGRVYGVVARTSVGKTIFGCHVAATHGKDDKGLLFCSLEMEASEVVGRLARMGLHVPDADRRIGDYADAYIAHYGSVAICDRPGLTLAQVEQLIRSEQRRRAIVTTVIDYIGLLRTAQKGLSAYERVSEHAIELKEVAKRTQTAIIALVQISRQAGGDGSEEVGLNSGRDSGVLEEAMDCGIGLRWLGACRALSQEQRTEWRDVIWCRVFKNRHGRISACETALRRDPHTLALTADESLAFPELLLAAARKKQGGF
jgi:replicative DNA helicase